jgi:hypothetical protein
MSEEVTMSDICNDCGKTIVKPEGSCGTGYATVAEGQKEVKVCYACCAERDKKWMDENDKITLYLTEKPDGYEVNNWPGTLKFRVRRSRKGYHNIARSRTDVWFRDHAGREWWGVLYGEWTQLCHCKKLKRGAA